MISGSIDLVLISPSSAPLESRLGAHRKELRGAFRGTRERVDAGVRAIVVGGGVAGIAAATVLAERGVEVTLLEREPFLGGRAAAYPERFPDGETFRMERGFPALFRHYYNLRSLLRRIDPDLRSLRPLTDYPVIGQDGAIDSFAGLPTSPPLNVIALLRRTPFVSLADLRKLDVESVRALLTFDPLKSYGDHDRETAAEYLDRLALPARARELLFRVFCHGAFFDESTVSAAEMLLLLHFHFLGNPEGMAFDVPEEPTSDAIFAPFARYLGGLGVKVALGKTAERVCSSKGDKIAVETGDATLEAEGAVLALDVRGIKSLFDVSPDLRLDPELASGIAALDTSPSCVVYRLFLDRPAEASRPSYTAVVGNGLLDGIALFDRLEGESRRWALRTGGTVVQLWAFGVPDARTDEHVKKELLATLMRLYPELTRAAVVHSVFLREADRPAFAPGSSAHRPKVGTVFGNVALAGDWVKLPFPTAMMERAAASGIMAANALLDRWDVRGEPVWTIPPRGFMAALAGMRFGR
jgi:carotenoid phi-ring synthase / carotenoid chi-ring synthase